MRSYVDSTCHTGACFELPKLRATVDKRFVTTGSNISVCAVSFDMYILRSAALDEGDLGALMTNRFKAAIGCDFFAISTLTSSDY